MSLFPIPGPSPTTERVIEEVNNAASGGSVGWMTPVVAFLTALFATALAHVLTRSREGSSWLREKMFEIAQKLADNYNIIVAEGKKVPRWDGEDSEIKTAEQVNDYLAEQDWSAMEAAGRGYVVAVNQARLLVRSYTIHSQLTDAKLSAKFTVEYLTNGSKDFPKGSADHNGWYFTRKRYSDFDKFERRHDELMRSITDTYFEPRPWKFWRSVANVPYRIRRSLPW